MSAHLASDCPAVTICCPNQGCGREVPRSGLPEHMRECAVICRPADGAAEEVECPWGCGLCDSPLQMELHKAECLMEPRKLLAAIHKLHAENVRLDAENQTLRHHHEQMPMSPGSDSRKRPCAATAAASFFF